MHGHESFTLLSQIRSQATRGRYVCRATILCKLKEVLKTFKIQNSERIHTLIDCSGRLFKFMMVRPQTLHFTKKNWLDTWNTCTRSDIFYFINLVSCLMEEPKAIHQKMAKRILYMLHPRYPQLWTTLSLYIYFTNFNLSSIQIVIRVETQMTKKVLLARFVLFINNTTFSSMSKSNLLLSS